MFSDIFEVRLADGTRVRGCFALWKRVRHILALAFDYGMPASLVVSTVQMVQFVVPGAIWHSDQGKQYGAEATRQALLEKGFQLSMSRAGTPPDNGSAERYMGLFKLAVAVRQPYHTLGDCLRAAEPWVNFYNTPRPHEGLGYRSPDQYAREQGVEGVPSITQVLDTRSGYLCALPMRVSPFLVMQIEEDETTTASSSVFNHHTLAQ